MLVRELPTAECGAQCLSWYLECYTGIEEFLVRDSPTAERSGSVSKAIDFLLV